MPGVNSVQKLICLLVPVLAPVFQCQRMRILDAHYSFSGNACSLILIWPCTFNWVPSAQRAADITCGHPLRYALVVKGVLAASEAPQELLVAEGVQADAAVLSVLCGSSTPVPGRHCKLEAL